MQPSLPSTLLRRQRNLSEAQELVASWRASGQNKAAWCQSQDIPILTLKSCLAQIQRAKPVVASPGQSGFMEVHPSREVALGELRIELGGGVQLLGLDLAGVVAVLRGLRESSR
jgi:hypothetical protein